MLEDRIKLPFSPQTRKSDFILGALFSSIHVLLTTIVYHYVPDPYMDEIFHIGQTRSYCAGKYEWNPMITTPPALYILSIPFCGYERYVNSILMFFAIPAFCRFRRMFSRDDVWLTASIVGCLPILLQSSVLFYTDLLSLITVIWGFSIRSPIPSAFFFTLACLCRQTNIIWAAIYGIGYLFTHFNKKHKFWSIFQSLLDLWPFEFLALSFATFIYWNNYQIVLGDAKAHQPKFHLAQFFYMFAFCAFHSWPNVLNNLFNISKKLLNLKSFILISLIGLGIHYFSFDHPYLIADNRHFTFYIWQRFLSKPPIRLSLSPIYLFSIYFMSYSTSKIHPIFHILFLFASFLVLVPAHLFEMRYYIIPFTVWRLSSSSSNSSKISIYIELLSNICIFSGVMYLFLFKPFIWSNEPGSLQRFMF